MKGYIPAAVGYISLDSANQILKKLSDFIGTLEENFNQAPSCFLTLPLNLTSELFP